MNKDRFIQLIAMAVAFACLVATVTLGPVINEQRRDLQLTYDLERGDRTKASYALAAAALGTFRGIVADAAWYRAEMLKRDGKFYDANTLAQWITTLQPRFPQVWAFHAWNMAYNISVQTHTPEERWDWVNKGVRLLREEGIPYNPNATRLYRELGWIFFHKFGKYSDDMHWYYKRRLAQEWQEVLGAPTEGATPAQVNEQFRPIAEAADNYFVFNRLTMPARTLIDELAQDHGEFADTLLDMKDLNAVRAEEILTRLERDAAAGDNPSLVRALEPLREMVDAQVARRTQVALNLLYENAPETQGLRDQVRATGVELNGEGLIKLGRILMLLEYRSPTVVRRILESDPEQADLLALFELWIDPDNRAGWDALLPFWRAKVLTDEYNMDPGVMYELMELFGPIDWRHPAAHGIYWSFLGVRKAGELIDTSKIDLLNTDRQVIHGLQELMYFGRVSYDPFTGELDLLPNVGFIPAYDKAMDLSLERMYGSDFTQKEGTISNFQAGHENFLVTAAVYSYLYGDTEDARKYIDKARNLYAELPHNVRDGRYQLALDDFIMDELSGDIDRFSTLRQFIDAMLSNGIRQGLALDRPEVFSRFLRIAQEAHEKHQDSKIVTAISPQDRMRFLDFDRTVEESLINYMRDPQVPLLTRRRAYLNMPEWMKENTYARFRVAVNAQAAAQGLDGERAFPPPGNFDAESAQVAELENLKPAETIEEQ